MILALAGNRVLSVMLTIFVVGFLIFLSYLLLKKIIKDFKEERYEKQNRLDGVISRAEIELLITRYINQVGNNQFGLLYIDIDKFGDFKNAFNDNEVKIILSKLISNIKSVLPTDIVISRYQGDEFIVLFNSKYKRDDVLSYGRKLLEKLREPIKLYEHTKLEQTASISIAFYPIHGNRVSNLIKSLQLAMYKVKKAGGNNLTVYSKDALDTKEDANYYYEIKEAMEKEEFTFYYQPIFNLETKKVHSIESLIRWHHPTLGLLTPNKFMPIMEQSGDIYWVGLWGLEQLIKTYKIWSENGINAYPTINLSLKQLMYDEIATDFQKIIKRTKVNPNNIYLEIEEFALFDANSKIYKNLLKLKDVGFRITVDGYGIDFNALEQIEKLNVDAIKFKYNVLMSEKTYAAEKMLETILEFIDDKNKDLIVQDVETEDMINNVNKYNAKLGQGYYFSKVLPQDKLMELLEDQSRVDYNLDN